MTCKFHGTFFVCCDCWTSSNLVKAIVSGVQKNHHELNYSYFVEFLNIGSYGILSMNLTELCPLYQNTWNHNDLFNFLNGKQFSLRFLTVVVICKLHSIVNSTHRKQKLKVPKKCMGICAHYTLDFCLIIWQNFIVILINMAFCHVSNERKRWV